MDLLFLCAIFSMIPIGILGGGVPMPSFNNSVSNYTEDYERESFTEAFRKFCNKPLVFEELKQVWDYDLCSTSWRKFAEVGNFTDHDFQMPYPRHIRRGLKGQSKWAEDKHNGTLAIPGDYCVLQISGWFSSKGTLFDCNNQYLMLTKPGRPDLKMGLGYTNSPDNKDMKNKMSLKIYGDLHSTLIPFNNAFSHAFSTGVSHAVYMLPLLARNSNNKILVPSGGPMASLLESLGVPKSQIIATSGSENYYFSHNATLVLRRHPFNIIQAHWPAHALEDMRIKLIQNLIKQGYVNSDLPQKEVLYLARPTGFVRSISESLENFLLAEIRKKLNPGFTLHVIGKEMIQYSSDESKLAWRSTADLFARAAAVIGVHGGAFGNTFLCPPNTTIIEVNVPWSPANADGDSTHSSALVRDLFYSTARGTGNVENYWTVWPQNLETYSQQTDFYNSKTLSFYTGEVLEILAIAGIVTNVVENVKSTTVKTHIEKNYHPHIEQYHHQPKQLHQRSTHRQ